MFIFQIFQIAVFDPKESKGFLGTKLKTIAKKKRVQTAFLDKINSNALPTQVSDNQKPTWNTTGTLDDVDWLVTAHYINDLDEIINRHQATFHLRQQLIKAGQSIEIPAKYPRFFDVDCLVGFF